MKTFDMRQCTDEFAKNISAYGKVSYITFKNDDYNVTINSINFFKKNFDNIHLETGYIIPELKNGDIVRIVPTYEKINLSSKNILEEETVEEGLYKLRCINKKFGSTAKLEYIFKEVEFNYTLKFQNRLTKQIHERRCMITPFVRLGRISDSHGYEIQIQIDEETKLFHSNQRFLIGLENNNPIAYRIMQINSITDQDNLIMRVERDQINENDNYELMVANYIEPEQEDTTPLLGSCEIKYSGEPSLRVGGSTKTFTGTFKDKYGKEITEIISNWELDFSDYPELSGRVYVVKESGNKITLTVVHNDSFIDKSFDLLLYSDSLKYGHYENTLKVTIKELF